MKLFIIFSALSIVSLIGVRFIPRKGRLHHFWLVCCIVNISIMIYFAFSSYKSAGLISKLKDRVSSIQEYSSIARLDALGNPDGFGLGSDFTYNSELTSMLKGTYTTKDNKFQMLRDSESESKYRAVIKKYPKFPFAYYFLALCLREKGDESWRTYCQKAISILEKTVAIDGHNENHDEALRKLHQILGSDPYY